MENPKFDSCEDCFAYLIKKLGEKSVEIVNSEAPDLEELQNIVHIMKDLFYCVKY